MAERRDHRQHAPFRIPLGMAFCIFAAIAIFFLWQEHRAHILGFLPYALLLLCPLIHLFLHRGRGDHHDHRNSGEGGRQ